MTAREAFIDPNAQKFTPAGGGLFFEIKIPVVLDKGEMPPYGWKWDSILFPNKVGAVEARQIGVDEAINKGLLAADAGPKCLECLDRGYRLFKIEDRRELDRIGVYYWYWTTGYDIELCGCNPEITHEQMYRNISVDYCSDNLDVYYRTYAKITRIPDVQAGGALEVPRIESFDQPLMLLAGEPGCFPEAMGIGRRTTSALQFHETYPDERPKAKRKSPIKKKAAVSEAVKNPYADGAVKYAVDWDKYLKVDLKADDITRMLDSNWPAN